MTNHTSGSASLIHGNRDISSCSSERYQGSVSGSSSTVSNSDAASTTTEQSLMGFPDSGAPLVCGFVPLTVGDSLRDHLLQHLWGVQCTHCKYLCPCRTLSMPSFATGLWGADDSSCMCRFCSEHHSWTRFCARLCHQMETSMIPTPDSGALHY